MNRNRRWRTKLARQVVFIAVIIVQSLIAADVYACQCREREPPCTQYGTADVVFVGSVVTIALEGLGPRQRIVFSIERDVKGLSGSTAELVNYGSSCDYAFAEGNTYLVYAYRNAERNELYTHHCTPLFIDYLEYQKYLGPTVPRAQTAVGRLDCEKTFR